MEKDISFKFTITEKILPVLVNIICYNPTLLHFEFANVRIESDLTTYFIFTTLDM